MKIKVQGGGDVVRRKRVWLGDNLIGAASLTIESGWKGGTRRWSFVGEGLAEGILADEKTKRAMVDAVAEQLREKGYTA